jgi:hypothetical protein
MVKSASYIAKVMDAAPKILPGEKPLDPSKWLALLATAYESMYCPAFSQRSFALPIL